MAFSARHDCYRRRWQELMDQGMTKTPLRQTTPLPRPLTKIRLQTRLRTPQRPMRQAGSLRAWRPNFSNFAISSKTQSKLLQAQSEQLKEQQQRMQVLESEVNSSSAIATALPATANGSASGQPHRWRRFRPGGWRAKSSSGQTGSRAGNESPWRIHFKGVTHYARWFHGRRNGFPQ